MGANKYSLYLVEVKSFKRTLISNSDTLKTKHILIALFTISVFTCFHHNALGQSKIEKGMTKVTIMYPNEEGKTFDMEYYASKHMPLVASLFGDALKAIQIDKGINGRAPEDSLPYVAIGYLYFDSLEDYQKGIGPNIEKIRADIPNYTDIQPVILISEVIQ